MLSNITKRSISSIFGRTTVSPFTGALNYSTAADKNGMNQIKRKLESNLLNQNIKLNQDIQQQQQQRQ
ncbi:hypothetical protein PPL_01792 [Heterostelium album PN500]|uniref:Uncharacterized protein n=1 Tax=Heterostelium pallidum (strain ATCC 26659 / Pp 5 / PN500) TaxID=670386 RepID=D3B0H5_HETP5|nr:hypothetical protein PPL_01792 [Heterostelium album PN500]EFA84799.1 hypothetical protein PPL_01792 [Heterostelium album PN500]|eukprot:XP_020436910.1 hypothetical protein PPL_01792 [Heterostelium album PN500]